MPWFGFFHSGIILYKHNTMPTTSNNSKIPIRIEGIQPILAVQDMNDSRAFYIGILGFQEEPWGGDDFTCVKRDKASIYLCRGAQGKPGMWLWVGFDGDIFSWHSELVEKGVTIRQPPQNYSWALEMHIEDPDGHILRLGTGPDPGQPFRDQ